MNHVQKPLFKEGESKQIAVFDIDGTLTCDTPDELSGRVYWYMHSNDLLQNDDGTSRALHELREQYLCAPTDTTHRTYLDQLNRAFDKQVILHRPSTIQSIAQRALLDIEIYPVMTQELAKFQNQEIPILLATGSPTRIAGSLAQQVGAQIFIGSHYPDRGDRFLLGRRCESRSSKKDAYLRSVLVDLSLRTMSSDTKQLLRYEDKHRPSYDDIPDPERVTIIAGYGNTISDKGIFDLSDEAIVVNPRGALKVIAVANNLRTIQTSMAETRLYDMAG